MGADAAKEVERRRPGAKKANGRASTRAGKPQFDSRPRQNEGAIGNGDRVDAGKGIGKRHFDCHDFGGAHHQGRYEVTD